VKSVPIGRTATVRALDEALIGTVGIPAAMLVDTAAHACAVAFRARHPLARRVLILTGPGNNGADGWAMARHLARDVRVRVQAVHAPTSEPARLHASIAGSLGLVGDLDSPDVVIDAVFGTGQRGPVDVPALRDHPAAIRVALDVPTGIDAETGAVLGDHPTPDDVLVIGWAKPFVLGWAGPWTCVDIGLSQAPGARPDAVWRTSFVPERSFPATADKWRRGHVGVWAGSAEMAGAAVLCCRGALRAGAGLVSLFAPPEAWSRLGTLPPEVMLHPAHARDTEAGARCDAWVVGPGLGRSADAAIRDAWRREPRPMVVDADALRALGDAPGPAGGPRLLTPHVGEAAALLGRSREAVTRDRLGAVTALRAFGAAILKGPNPMVTGAPPQALAGGTPQLGTAGSGDVLAGACGAMVAAAMRTGALSGPAWRDPLEALALDAAALHLEAGRRAGPVGCLASDIADAWPRTGMSVTS
jgi:hydroxyethylthiazole kinase-like uncharacterized protein yjeF